MHTAYRAAPAPTGGESPGVSITMLTPFLGSRPTITARVTEKMDVKHFSSQKTGKDGKLFSCTLVDETGSIRITFFNETVDQYFAMLQNESVYKISGFSCKTANARWNTGTVPYELTFESHGTISEVRGAAAADIPMMQLNTIPVGVVKSKEPGCNVNVVGIVTRHMEPMSLNKLTQAGTQMLKKTVTVADGKHAVDVTLWNEQIEALQAFQPGTPVAIKGLRVTEYLGTVSLTYGRMSNAMVPPAPLKGDVEGMVQWYQTTQGRDVENISMRSRDGGEGTGSMSTKRRQFRGLDEDPDVNNDKGTYYEFRCMPIHINTTNLTYPACKACNKKVTVEVAADEQGHGGQYSCPKCGSATPEVELRYMFSAQCSDGTDTRYVTFFSEAATAFMGLPAAETTHSQKLVEEAVVQRMYVPMLLTCRCRMETRPDPMGGDRQDVRLTAVRFREVCGTDLSAKAQADFEAKHPTASAAEKQRAPAAAMQQAAAADREWMFAQIDQYHAGSAAGVY